MIIKSFKPDNATIIKGSLRNLLDGSRAASIPQFVDKFGTIYQDSEGVNFNKFLPLYNSGATLILYNPQAYIFTSKHDNKHVDFIIIQNYRLMGYHVNSKAVAKVSDRLSININDIGLCIREIYSKLFNSDDWEQPDNYSIDDIQVLAFDSETGSLLIPQDIYKQVPLSDIEDAGFKLDELNTKSLDNTETNKLESKSEAITIKQFNEINKQEIKTMSKVTAIVNANKSAAVNAAKLEAGNIALKQITKVAAKALPNGMVGTMLKPQLDTPLGRVIVANLLNFAVDQYAPRNAKAKMIALAAMDAAMLEMVQSFNISQMIDEMVKNIDVTTFDFGTGE